MDPRSRRALILGALAIGTGVLVRVVPAAVAARAEVQRVVAAREASLDAHRREIAGAPALELAADSVKRGLVTLAPRLVAAGGEIQAVERVAQHLGAAADRAGASMLSFGPRRDSTRVGRMVAVVLDATFEADFPGVFALLEGIADAGPSLRIMEMRITAADPRADASVPERLEVDLTIRGWYVPEQVE